MRYFINFSYDGSNFHGYQKQPNKRTIQEELETALTQINNNEKVIINSSGRTDAKVHALAARAHFDINVNIDINKLKLAINSLTPDDIYIKEINIVEDNFHARFDATGKEYIYKLNMGEYEPLSRNYVYQYNKKLDLVAVERAMKYLEGEHNFKSFTKVDEEKDDYVRTLCQCNLIRDFKNINNVTFTFTGTGFLRYMVRTMVGTLIEIGEGKRKSEDIINIFASQDRTMAGKTAAPEGLYLRNVFY